MTLQPARPGFHIFRVDDYGAPSYPELVLCATAPALRRDPGLARAVVRALVRGYAVDAEPIPRPAQPTSSRASRDSTPKLVSAELAAVEPAFVTPASQFGELDPATLRAWARWELRFGIVRRLPDVQQAFDPQFVSGAGSAGSG